MGTRPGGAMNGTMNGTINIEVVLDTTDQDEMLSAIQRVLDQMQIGVELASPADLIPLPTQWTTQSRYVGRSGSVDVFYFDFYSLALSKVARGADRDLMGYQALTSAKSDYTGWIGCCLSRDIAAYRSSPLSQPQSQALCRTLWPYASAVPTPL